MPILQCRRSAYVAVPAHYDASHSRTVEGSVAASTQNQAVSALGFFYGEVLNVELDWLQGLVRAKRPERLPMAPTRDEVRRLLAQLQGTEWLMAC